MLQELFDLDNSSYGTIKGRKSLCMQIFDFALKRELVEKNYGTLIDINKKNEKVIKRKIFTSALGRTTVAISRPSIMTLFSFAISC